MIDYGYDDRDRLLTETGIAGGYSYDDNGNLTTKDAEATYTWDFENRLTNVSKSDGTIVDHAYDADGNRVRTTTTKPGQALEIVDYLVDTSGSLSHVVAETDASGALKAYYVRGDDLLAVMRPDGTGGFTTRFVHADGIGSIRRLTDEGGNITDGYSYSSFGELLAHTGSDPQPYAFAGEPYDPNVGFQYHRARWMDPRVGRFLGMDPFEGFTHDPSTLHRYLYVQNSPLDATDPTGEWSLWEWASIGRAVHQTVDMQYLMMGAVVDWPISPTNPNRPDIRFHRDAFMTPFTAGEVYEIKPFAEARTAAGEVLWYIAQLRLAYPSVDWRPGALIPPPRSYYPMGQFIHPLLMGKAVRVELSGSGDGVIVYSIEDNPTTRALPALAFAIATGAILAGMVGLAALARF